MLYLKLKLQAMAKGFEKIKNIVYNDILEKKFHVT
jgi:hypothetical protein